MGLNAIHDRQAPSAKPEDQRPKIKGQIGKRKSAIGNWKS
jgi:hypothetical protein